MNVTVDFNILFQLEQGKVTVLAGRPGMGTSSLALTIARHYASSMQSVYMYTPDELIPSVQLRACAQEAMVDMRQLPHLGGTDFQERERIAKAVRKNAKSKLVLDDQPHGGDLMPVLKRARKCKRLGLLVIDCPLSRTDALAFENPQETLLGLQRFARKHKIPVLLCETVSRICDERDNHRPRQYDLKGRDLYQDIGKKILLYRERYYKEELNTDTDAAEIFIYDGHNCECVLCNWYHGVRAFLPYENAAANELYKRGKVYYERYLKNNDLGDGDWAVFFWEKAADMGHLEAENAVADYYYEEGKIEEAIGRFEALARKGHVPSMRMLADLYLIGYDVDYNAEKGLSWLQKAADLGDVEAQVLLGDCYRTGKHVEFSAEKAMALYTLAARQGNEEAKLQLRELSK